MYGKVYGAVPAHMQGLHIAAQPKPRPSLPVLLGCLFVPWLLFCTTFWLQSFEHADGLSLILGLVVFVFTYMTVNLSRNGGDYQPMAFVTVTSLAMWIVAFAAGSNNYSQFIRPFNDISNLNVYPNVDPSKYAGSQLMDAGMIKFTKGSRLQLDKSIGFKNKDIFCVAPIVSGPKSNQTTHDFWAVGINCCSGHTPDFRCGEFTNPDATWGLRLMDDSKREMFRLAVMEATATFGLKAPSPVFLYWLSDPAAEVNAYEDDAWKFFSMFVCGALGVQLILLLFGLVLMHGKY